MTSFAELPNKMKAPAGFRDWLLALVVYMRSDFAEQLACALMPLVVLAALQLCGLTENRRGSLSRALASFAVVFAAVWLSNAPAAVITSYSVAFIFTWAALVEKSL